MGKPSELRRMQAVWLYGSGVSMTVIAQVAQDSERSIRRWIEAASPALRLTFSPNGAQIAVSGTLQKTLTTRPVEPTATPAS